MFHINKITEYAHSELTASLTTKQQCETHTIQVEKQVRKIGQQLKGKRVKLVGLTQNVKWNGRTGVIVKLVIEGEDCGRWKVRLDKEQRGGDPDGMDGRDSLNGEARGDGRHQQQQQYADRNEEDEEHNAASHHVVAKAENLELVDEVDPIGLDGGVLLTASNISTRSRSRSNKSRTSSRSGNASGMSGKSRDPTTSRCGENFHTLSPYSNDRARTPVAVTPDQKYSSPRQQMKSPLSPPQVMSPKRNEKDLPSAFSNMLLSPVSFENVSFTAVPSDSFVSQNKSMQQTMPGGTRDNDDENGRSDSSVAGSFFDEVTPQEQSNQSFPFDRENQVQHYSDEKAQYQMQCNHSVEGESHRGYPQEIYSTDLPTLVILPVQDDGDATGNSPNCIGVQGAGVPHINGVYLLANDQNSASDGPPSSPLYFKDAQPTLLEDDRYYGEFHAAMTVTTSVQSSKFLFDKTCASSELIAQTIGIMSFGFYPASMSTHPV